MKAIAFLQTAVLLVLLCGGSARAEAPPDRAGRVVVSYWEKWTDFEKDAMQAVVDDFNRSQDRIYVDYVSVSGVVQKTLVATQAGSPPDLAGMWANEIADLAEKNVILPLDSYAAGTIVRGDRYLPVFWDMVTYQGKVYGVPSTPVTIAFYWNKDLFRAAGLDPDTPPRTIAELDAFAEHLTRVQEGRIVQMGFLPSEPIWWPHFWPYLFHGKLWDGGAQIGLDSPENVRAFTWVQGYAKRYGVAALQNLSASFGNFASAQDPFMSGKLAMTLQGVWLANYAARYAPNLHYGAAPIPALNAGDPPMGVADTDILAIPNGAKHAKEAFEFIRYFSSQPVTEKLAILQRKNTPLRAISDDFWREHEHPYIRLFQDLASSPATVPAQPTMSVWHEYRTEIANAFQRVWLMQATPKQALTEARERIQKSWDRERRRQGALPSALLEWAPAMLVGLLVGAVVALGVREHRRTRGRVRLARSNTSFKTGLLFFSPWGIGMLTFMALPLFMSLVYSFCDYSMLSGVRWVGLANFVDLFQDEVFWVALRNTLIFVVCAVPLGLLFALYTALLLDANLRGSSVYRTLVFLPSLTPVVATAFVWMWILNGQFGVLNDLISKLSFGLIHHPISWLSDPRTALSSIVFMSLWGIGQTSVILLAAMQDVPSAMYEAAEIDGASLWVKVRHITIPLISPVIYFNAIVAVIGALQLFTLPYIMTGGGPARATLTYTMRVYENAFAFLRMGYASAMSWILFLIILGLTLLIVRVAERRVHYTGT
jgi:ABC-type sugar transport system permease subunit/ABC-type glycerol-3-phosphate transport system substrate-binding protein